MVVFLGKWQNLDIFIARRSKIIILLSLHWRHNELDSVSNNRLIGCLLSRFRRGSKTYALTWAQHIVCRDLFLPEACFGLRELSLPACIHICVCVSVYLSVRLSVRPSVRLSVCLSVCLSDCLSVSPCVRQSRACPRDNLWPVQASITKFWPEVRNNLVKIPIVLRGRSTLTSSVKFDFKIRFYPILSLKFVCMITHHLVKLESPNLEQRCETPCLRYFLFLEVIIKRVNIPLLG